MKSSARRRKKGVNEEAIATTSSRGAKAKKTIQVSDETEFKIRRFKEMIATGISLGNPALHASAFIHQLNMKPSNLQKSWVTKFGNTDEKDMMQNKSKKLNLNHILIFIKSFELTHNKQQGKVYGAHQSIFLDKDGIDPGLANFWGATKSKYIFIPILYGLKGQSHFAAVALSLKKRIIQIYNSKKIYGGRRKRAGDDIDGLIEMDALVFKNQKVVDKEGKEILNGPETNFVHTIYKKILLLEEQTKAVPIKWRLQVVNKFISQQNNLDCGVFGCFFFQTVALGNPVILNLNLKNNQHVQDAKHTYLSEPNLDNFREWVAYSMFIHRIMNDE